jgi:hypothetical protein
MPRAVARDDEGEWHLLLFQVKSELRTEVVHTKSPSRKGPVIVRSTIAHAIPVTSRTESPEKQSMLLPEGVTYEADEGLLFM